MWSHDYRVASVDNIYDDSPRGNTVLFKIGVGGSTEMLLVKRAILLQVSALKGVGEAVIYDPNIDWYRAEPLVPGDVQVFIQQGNVYYYRNTGNEPLILRDDCQPPFQEGDEAALLDSERELPVPPEFLLRYIEGPIAPATTL
jgi:hypothetical protein